MQILQNEFVHWGAKSPNQVCLPHFAAVFLQIFPGLFYFENWNEFCVQILFIGERVNRKLGWVLSWKFQHHSSFHSTLSEKPRESKGNWQGKNWRECSNFRKGGIFHFLSSWIQAQVSVSCVRRKAKNTDDVKHTGQCHSLYQEYNSPSSMQIR